MPSRPSQSDAVGRKVASHVKSVLLIDKYPVVGLGLELAFRICPGLFLVKKISNPSDAIPAIAECLPDAIVLDLVFDEVVHLSLIQEIRTTMPSARIVVFSSLPAELYEKAVIEAGTDFYLTKDHDCSDLVSVLIGPVTKPLSRDTAPAEAAFVRRMMTPANHEIRPMPHEAHLTPREHEIASLLSRGLSVADIARMVQASKK